MVIRLPRRKHFIGLILGGWVKHGNRIWLGEIRATSSYGYVFFDDLDY